MAAASSCPVLRGCCCRTIVDRGSPPGSCRRNTRTTLSSNRRHRVRRSRSHRPTGTRRDLDNRRPRAERSSHSHHHTLRANETRPACRGTASRAHRRRWSRRNTAPRRADIWAPWLPSIQPAHRLSWLHNRAHSGLQQPNRRPRSGTASRGRHRCRAHHSRVHPLRGTLQQHHHVRSLVARTARRQRPTPRRWLVARV